MHAWRSAFSNSDQSLRGSRTQYIALPFHVEPVHRWRRRLGRRLCIFQASRSSPPGNGHKHHDHSRMLLVSVEPLDSSRVPGGNRTLFGSVVALATSVTVATIWILANVLAFFYRSAKIKDWLTIPWKYLRIPFFVLSVLLVSMDIMTPLFTEVAASMFWVLFLIALQIAATSQLLVCGVIFGFTRFTKWKLFLFSVGLYILLVHTSAVTIVTAFSTASGSFVVWLIGSVVFDFVLVLPYSLWLGRQRIMHTVWESTFLNDKPV